MDTSEQVKKLINLTKTIRSVLNLIGWWTPLLSLVGALGWTTWAGSRSCHYRTSSQVSYVCRWP